MASAVSKSKVYDWDSWEPVRIGPTWQTTPDGESYVLPEYTLGWECARWCAKWLQIEDPVSGGYKPFTFTDEQLRWTLWFYAVDKSGRFLYQRKMLQRAKGTGKDYLAAAYALFEAVGPCRLDYIDESGECHGRPLKDAYVQLGAVSQEQTRNTSDLFKSLLSPEAIDNYDFSVGLEVTYARGGLSQIHCLTSNPFAAEGKRPTFLVCNEVQWWLANNKGIDMYTVLKGNISKRPLYTQAHMFIIANAPIPGQGSVGEQLIQSFEDTLAGKASDTDLLYDSLEAPADTPIDREHLPRVIEGIRGDSFWLDPETVAKDFFDPLTPVSEARRKWFNQVTADSDAVYSKAQIVGSRRVGVLRPGDEIVLGFDGGRSDDSTALVAIRVSDRVAFPIRIWERPLRGKEAEDWVVPYEQVDSAVHDTFAKYSVKAFFADVNLWESYIMEWSNTYSESLVVKASANSAVAWDMRRVKVSTEAHQRLVAAIQHGQLFHNGDPVLMQHMGNARKRVNVHGLSFGKESRESSRKVDGYAALMIAFEALHRYLAEASKRPEKRVRSGRAVFF